MKTEIKSITAREVLDSRSNPTVEAEVTLMDGSVGVASVPSGASTGSAEAIELRDVESRRYHGKGVTSAVENVKDTIYKALVGVDALDQTRIDSIMIALDGMYNKSNLGANAILSVSIASAKAAAASLGLPLYRYLGGMSARTLPVPMMNIINGGAHAANNIDIQEFMILPLGAESFSEGVRICSEIYHTLRSILNFRDAGTGVGDEGGFAPMLDSDEDAIELILKAVCDSGYNAPADICLALDAATSEWRCDGGYHLPKRGTHYTSDELVSYFSALVSKYPIISLEDGMGEDDTMGWKRLTQKLSPRKTMLVGDDYFVTNAERVRRAVKNGIANAVLIKPNQIGTLTETAEAIRAARDGGYKVVLSHRSAETEDTALADIAVAFGADYIKTGAPARGERTAKYNRLMKIESELFDPLYSER